MATYELALLIRNVPKVELVSTLKRASSCIFDKGGIIRRIDNLGKRKTPYKISSHGMVHKEANYFVVEFSAPPSKLEALLEEYNRDVDIVRSRIYKPVEEKSPECTLEEEMKPAPYRPAVIKLLEDVKKKEEFQNRRKYKDNSGLDYYPFQR